MNCSFKILISTEMRKWPSHRITIKRFSTSLLKNCHDKVYHADEKNSWKVRAIKSEDSNLNNYNIHELCYKRFKREVTKALSSRKAHTESTLKGYLLLVRGTIASYSTRTLKDTYAMAIPHQNINFSSRSYNL